MTEIYGIATSDLGAAALVGVVVLLVLTGRLVPRSHLSDLRADRDARIQEIAGERDTWRDAHQVSEEARREAQDQVGELLELSRTADHVLRSLPRPGEVTASARKMDQASIPPS
jgi:hypothetical protein